MKLTSRRYCAGTDDDLLMATSQDVFYFTEGALAYAGYYLHTEDNPLHTHSRACNMRPGRRGPFGARTPVPSHWTVPA
jgi:hypothetical protein